MRKLFWCYAVVALAAGVGVYAAASHASENPDSAIGRAMVGTYFTLVKANPLAGLTGKGNMRIRCCDGTSRSACEPAAPAACTAAIEIRASGANTSAPGCSDEGTVPCRLPGQIIISEEEEPRENAAWQAFGAVVELIAAPRIVIDESELMPIPDDYVPPDAYGFYEEYSSRFLLPVKPGEALPYFVRDRLPTLVANLPPAVDSAPEVMPPADDAAPEIMPPADEDKTQLKDFLGLWAELLRKTTFAPLEPREEPSEAPDYSRPPNCPEDSDHNRPNLTCPYHGCPQDRMSCPFTGKIVPSTVPESSGKYAPSTTAPEPKEVAVPATAIKHEVRKPKNLPDGFEESDEKAPKQRTIDTMEFRPSDAKPNEFGLVPF